MYGASPAVWDHTVLLATRRTNICANRYINTLPHVNVTLLMHFSGIVVEYHPVHYSDHCANTNLSHRSLGPTSGWSPGRHPRSPINWVDSFTVHQTLQPPPHPSFFVLFFCYASASWQTARS